MFSNITYFLNGLRTDPSGTLITLAYLTVCILFSLIIHECAHGWVALKCGDPTAKMLGRLTLDPRKHLDPIGTFCMVFLRVGWAKPVPVNPRNFRNYRRDYILVSLAGIITNFCIFLICLIISALLAKAVWPGEYITAMEEYHAKDSLLNVYYDFSKAPFNLSDGYISVYSASAVYSGSLQAAESVPAAYIQRLFLMLAQMNLGLAVFNLLPVPPLDGYRFLDQFVFKGRLRMEPQTMMLIRIGFLVVCFSGLLSGLLGTVNGFIFGVFSRIFSVMI